jgi:opine dehydrogenase
MHICRASENWLDQQVARIILERKNVQVSAMPSKNNKDIFKTLNKIYSIFTPATNVLETSLNNDNPMYHGPVVLMNAGWLEHTKGKFMIYRDGLTPSVGKCIDELTKERNDVVRSFGIKTQSTTSSYKLIRNSKWPNDPCEVGPKNLQHRYITEDVPYGLVPLTYFGNLMDINTPLSDAIIEIASIVNEENYWINGTTLKKLELNNMKPKEILKFLYEGK